MIHHIMLPSTYPVASHTDHVGVGTTFVAMSGQRHSVLHTVPRALAAGAGCIVMSPDDQDAVCAWRLARNAEVPVVFTHAPLQALATYSAEAHHHAHKKLCLIGVTGTKGKTSIAHMMAHVLRWHGAHVGLISSAGKRIRDVWMHTDTECTTPNADELHAFLHTCLLHGVRYVVIEVSAQALSLSRVHGLQFDTIIMSNIQQEHGEFYPSHKAYMAAKSRIYEHLAPAGQCIINADDDHVLMATPTLKNGHLRYFGAVRDHADHIHVATCDTKPVCLFHHGWRGNLSTRLFGMAQAYNVAAVMTAVPRYGVSWHTLVKAFATFSGVPRRMQYIPLLHGAYAMLDYAHNPQSYQAVLSHLSKRFSCIYVVCGAGGDRDRNKRPEMMRIASIYAHYVIITQDTSRTEPLEQIITDLVSGIASSVPYEVIHQRSQALDRALAIVPQNGVVAILGRGHTHDVAKCQTYAHRYHVSRASGSEQQNTLQNL